MYTLEILDDQRRLKTFRNVNDMSSKSNSLKWCFTTFFLGRLLGCHVGCRTARTFSLGRFFPLLMRVWFCALFKIPVRGGGSHFPLFAWKKGEMKRGHGKTNNEQEQRQTTWRMEKSSSAWCNNKEASLNKRIAPRAHVRYQRKL